MNILLPHKTQKNDLGFTLIELLVVIAIISILASVTFAGLNVAKVRARDTRRVSDMRTLKIALESYSIDHGMFPCSVGAGGVCAAGQIHIETSTGNTLNILATADASTISMALKTACNSGSGWPANGALKAALDSNYIASVPVDPTNNGDTCYVYAVNPDRKGTSLYSLAEKFASGGAPYTYGITAGSPESTVSFTGYPAGFPIGTIGITEVISQGLNPNSSSGSGSNSGNGSGS